MSEVIDPVSPDRKYLKIVIAAAGVLIFGVAAFLFLRTRAAEAEPFLRLPGPTVTINAPAPGNVFQTGDLIQIQTNAAGQHPFQLTELWINGELVGTDIVPFEGINPWGSIFAWVPNEAGVYSLMARVVDSQENQTYSNGVVVYVQEAENQAADGGVGEGGEEEPDDEGSSSSSIVFPPAAPVSAPAVPPANGESPPLAPALSVQADGCDAVLSIQDQSENETGFSLYRQMLYEGAFVEIASFNPQEGSAALPAYSDTGLVGGITYYLTAFNGEGESSSNLAVVDIESEDCAPEDPEFDTLSLRYLSLTSDYNADQAYCYRSYNGRQWNRWPDIGFFPANGEGFVLPQEPDTFMLGELEGEPLFQAFDLQLACWGWEGETLMFLGELLFEGLGPDTLGDKHSDPGTISMEIALEVTKNLYPQNYSFNDGFQDLFFKLTHSKFDVSMSNKFPDISDLIITTKNMPIISAWKFFTEEACFLNLEPEAQVIFATLFLCSPAKGYHKGPGGINPQPFILWHIFELICNKEPCFPLNWWTNFAEQNGGEVVIWVHEASTAYPSKWETVDNPLRTVFRPEWVDCRGDRIFRVQMVIALPGGVTWAGPRSNPVIVKCTNEVTDQVQVEVKFTNLNLSHVSDGTDDILETYGSFAVIYHNTVGTSLELTKGRCSNGGSIYCYTNLADGLYSISQFYLCHSITVNDCPQGGPENESGYQQNNNSIVVPVRGGEALKIGAWLYDFDPQFFQMQFNSYNDAYCVASLWTPDKTLLDWASTVNEVYHLHQPDNGHAECTVDVVLNAVND